MTDTTDLAATDAATLAVSTDPSAYIAGAITWAEVFAKVVEDQRLYTPIRGRKHVRVEGWTTLGALARIDTVVAWTRPTEDHEQPVYEFVDVRGRTERMMTTPGRGGWVARVEARDRDTGAVRGAAESECRWDEPTWHSRDSYALRSMAQTRATSKALRLVLGHIVHLAGFDPTPEEEMPGGGAAIPAVDLSACPEGAKPIIWAKQAAMVLAGGHKEAAAALYAAAVTATGVDAATMDAAAAEMIVAEMTAFDAPESG